MKESAQVAIGRLFDEHGATLYRLGVRFCGSADEAQDLVCSPARLPLIVVPAHARALVGKRRSLPPATWTPAPSARNCCI